MADTPTPAGFGKCAVCAYRDTGTPSICYGCARLTFEGLADRRCGMCDLPFKEGEDACGNPLCSSYLYDCLYRRNYSIAMRSGALKDAISRYKYENKTGWAVIFARVLVGALRTDRETFSRFDLILASPSYTGAGAARKWNHTRLVLERAEQLAPGEWPFDLIDPATIIKTAATEPMVKKTWKQRRAIAEGSLRESLHVSAPNRVRGKVVLVYDDVFTDGQTLNEVARALVTAGAKSVCGITLARQPWGR